MIARIRKHFEKRKLEKFLWNLENNTFPNGYIKYHEPEIDCLKWLIASYKGRTSKPINYLESLINRKYTYNQYLDCVKYISGRPMTEEEMYERRLRTIAFLYNWVYYKEITAF